MNGRAPNTGSATQVAVVSTKDCRSVIPLPPRAALAQLSASIPPTVAVTIAASKNAIQLSLPEA